ncbi:MAG: hypothetical protein F4187_03885 [Gemmatimonadetes bacterium]|nr:hypothetical protein [Gemmatimonadota bacterium]
MGRLPGIENVRLLDLRHTFASRALALCEGLSMIGDLLGDRMVTTTPRFAHIGRHSVKVAAARISDGLVADMDTPPKICAVP